MHTPLANASSNRPRRAARVLTRIIPVAALATALVVAGASTQQTSRQSSTVAEPGRTSGALELTAARRITVRVRAASHHIASKRPSAVSVRLRQGKRAVHGGRLVLRVSGRTVHRIRISERNKQRRFALRVPGLRAGAHRVVAIYRGHGRRVISKSWVLAAHSTCAAAPRICGYPDASNTGVSAGAPLRTVSGGVRITQDGTVFENAIVGSIDIEADNVTIRNVRVTGTGEGWGIGMRATKNTTIENVEILPDGPRLLVGIKDVTGTSSDTHIRKTEIARTTTGIQVHEGLIEDNYIHDMGFKQGDHLNGTTSNGSTVPMTIRHNTIFNQYGQTDAVSLFQDFGPEGNRTVTDNLLAGGGYTIYAGGQGPTPTFNIKITNNRISRIFFPNGGSYGPLAKWENGTGNEWSGNIWDGSGAKVRR